MGSFKSYYDSDTTDKSYCPNWESSITSNYNFKDYTTTGKYPMSEIGKVFCHYNKELGRNVTVEEENKLKGDVINGKGSE